MTSASRVAPVPPVTRLARSLLQLACPSACASCGARGDPACARCLATLSVAPRSHRPDPAPEGLPPVLAIADYSGGVRDLITAWKERHHRSLATPLGEALADAVASTAVRRSLCHDGLQQERITLVPVPTSRASRRRRGEDAWGRVVAIAVQALAARGVSASVDPCLGFVRQPADQAGLRAQERARNLSGAMLCRGAPRGAVLLVDDVITTGATLAEAARCLALAGHPATLGLTLAATRRSGRAGRGRGSTLSL